MWAIYASAGQSCEARSRLLVERPLYDDVVAQVTELSQRVKVGDLLDAGADAIRIANDVRYGLMATVWTGDPARGHRVASKIKSGTVGIKMPYTAFPGIPFGRELALETLDLYLETKSVVTYTGTRPTNPFGL